MMNQIGIYMQHVIYLTPSQIKSFRKSYIVPQNYSNLKNKKRFIVFLTKTQIKKLDKAKANKEKVDLKFSKTQFKKTLNHVNKENRKNLQLLLKNIKEKNRNKLDKLNNMKINLSIKKNSKYNLDPFVKNIILKNEKNKPKPKKKKITDLIKFPEKNLI